MPTQQNDQTHSNNCLSVFDHFVGLPLKALNYGHICNKYHILRCGAYYSEALILTWLVNLNQLSQFCIQSSKRMTRRE